MFGDLTTLYDMAAPWIIDQIEESQLRFVIINNKGGQIFSRMFTSESYLNKHNLSFKDFSKLWGMEHQTWTKVPKAFTAKNHSLFELMPEEKSTKRFWERYAGLWSE